MVLNVDLNLMNSNPGGPLRPPRPHSRRVNMRLSAYHDWKDKSCLNSEGRDAQVQALRLRHVVEVLGVDVVAHSELVAVATRRETHEELQRVSAMLSRGAHTFCVSHPWDIIQRTPTRTPTPSHDMPI